MGKLKNDGHERFCQEYVKSLNITQSYIKAGYEENTARAAGSRLLTNVNIQERVAELQKHIALRNEVQASDIAREFMRLGYSNIQDFIKKDGSLKNIAELPRHIAACIQTVKTKDIGGGKFETEIKLYSKEKSLESLGKHIGWFEEHQKQKQAKEDLTKYTTKELIERVKAQKSLVSK